MFLRNKKKKNAAIPAPNSSEFGLADKLSKLWSSPIDQSPVYKDLPRLANRIIVTGSLNFKEVEEEEEKSVDTQYGIWIKSDLPEVYYKAAAWGNMYAVGFLSVTTKDKKKYVSIFEQPSNDVLFSESELTITAVLDSTRYFILETRDTESSSKLKRVGVAFENRKDSADFIEAIGIEAKPYQPPVDPQQRKKDQLKRILDAAGVTEEDLKDPAVKAMIIETIKAELAGLSSTDLHKLKEGEKEPQQQAESAEGRKGSARKQTPATSGEPLTGLAQIQHVMLSVAAELENTETYEAIRMGLEKMVDEGYTGEMQLVMEDLFKEAVGKDSKTARVFKAINQNIIFIPVIELKTKITKSDLITRDDRSPNGWRIEVKFEGSEVIITHFRRELPLAVAKADEQQFWWEWSLEMRFDKDMTDLHSAEIKITNLHFDEGLNPKYKDFLTKLLHGGKMVLR